MIQMILHPDRMIKQEIILWTCNKFVKEMNSILHFDRKKIRLDTNDCLITFSFVPHNLHPVFFTCVKILYLLSAPHKCLSKLLCKYI